MCVKNKSEEEKDVCKACIRWQDFKVKTCPKCGQEAVETELDGPCLQMKCLNCDYSVIGASFFAPCEQDRQIYSLKVLKQNLSNQQIVELMRLLNLPALEIRRVLMEEACINKQFGLSRLLDMIHSLETMGLAYSVEPELVYSRIFSCEKRMKIYEME